MNFTPQTLEELKKLNLENDKIYKIEYLDKDYFNGDEKLEITDAKAIVNEEKIFFLATDSYGMDKFITSFRVVK